MSIKSPWHFRRVYFQYLINKGLDEKEATDKALALELVRGEEE